jgi:hypothetical protein
MFFHLSPSRPAKKKIAVPTRASLPPSLASPTSNRRERGSSCHTQSGQQTIHPYPWRPQATSSKRRRRWCPSRCPRRRGGPRRWVGGWGENSAVLTALTFASHCSSLRRFGPISLGLSFDYVGFEGAGVEFERARVCRPRNCGEFSRRL